MRILLLLAGLGNARAGAAEPPWDADDALARALRVDDWIRNATDGRAGAPPNHWRVTHPSGLAAAPAPSRMDVAERAEIGRSRRAVHRDPARRDAHVAVGRAAQQGMPR